MKQIPLTQGKFALVDDEDFVFLSRFSWQYCTAPDGTVSVSTNFALQNKRWVTIPMSRFLYTPKIQYKVMYANGDTLDNRKENIKLLTTSQFCGTSGKMYMNTARKGKMKRNPTSKYKGVSYMKDERYEKRWVGSIQFQKKSQSKRFLTEKEAAIWYNKKAGELFGEYGYQNKIED
jgi:hypothetical protein